MKQVKWCSSAGASNKLRQTKIAHALTTCFQGFKHKLFCPSLWSGFGFVTFFARCPCFRHGSLLCPSSTFIHFVTLHPLHPLYYLHWVSFHFTHFSHFQSTGYQLFSSPASSLGLRQNLSKPLCGKQYIVFACIKVCLV